MVCGITAKITSVFLQVIYMGFSKLTSSCSNLSAGGINWYQNPTAQTDTFWQIMSLPKDKWWTIYYPEGRLTGGKTTANRLSNTAM